jgi:hypothetical protein
MKRRVCSYDMFAVPDPSFVLKDTVGEMYFCNLRCFCVWSVQFATRPNLSVDVALYFTCRHGRFALLNL